MASSVFEISLLAASFGSPADDVVQGWHDVTADGSGFETPDSPENRRARAMSAARGDPVPCEGRCSFWA